MFMDVCVCICVCVYVHMVFLSLFHPMKLCHLIFMTLKEWSLVGRMSLLQFIPVTPGGGVFRPDRHRPTRL